MSMKFLAFMTVVYLLFAIIGATMDNASNYDMGEQWTGGDPNESVFGALTNFGVMNQQIQSVGLVEMPSVMAGYFKAMGQVLMLRFSWLTGDGANEYMNMLWYFACLPLVVMSILFIITFFIGMIRGNITFG